MHLINARATGRAPGELRSPARSPVTPSGLVIASEVGYDDCGMSRQRAEASPWRSGIAALAVTLLAGCATTAVLGPDAGNRVGHLLAEEADHQSRVLHALARSYEEDLGDRQHATALYRRSAEASPVSPYAPVALRDYRRLSGGRLYLLADSTGRRIIWDAEGHEGPILLAPKVRGRNLPDVVRMLIGARTSASVGAAPVTLIQGEPYPYLTFILSDLGFPAACYVDPVGDLTTPLAPGALREPASPAGSPPSAGPRSEGR